MRRQRLQTKQRRTSADDLRRRAQDKLPGAWQDQDAPPHWKRCPICKCLGPVDAAGRCIDCG